MMMEIAARIFQVVILSTVAIGLIGIVITSLYDLRAVRRRARIDEADQRIQTKSARPTMTVLVYAYNDAEMIEGCLESLRRGQYGNDDLVVVDNASNDGTRQAVRRYMRKHPGFAMYLYAKRKHSPLYETFQQAYQKSRNGEIVVTLAASSRPSPSFLRQAAARIVAEPDLPGISVNERIDTPMTIDGLVPEIFRAVGRIFMKCSSLLKVRRDYIDMNGVYRADMITRRTKAYVRYEATLLLPVMRREQRRAAVLRPRLQVAGALAVFLLMSYSMIMAAILVSHVPLYLAWALTTIGSLAVVWSDESINTMRKLQLTFSSALVYFLLYVSLLSFLLERATRGATLLSKVPIPRKALYIRRRAIS